MESNTPPKNDLPVIQFLASVHKDQTALVYSIWGIFSTLSFILLGYLFTVKDSMVANSPPLLACFSLSVVAFAAGNHTAILRSQRLVHAATLDLRAMAESNPQAMHTLKTFDAPETKGLAHSHMLFTAFVAVGFWVPYLLGLAKQALSG